MRLSRLSGLLFNEDEINEVSQYLENMIEQMDSFIDFEASCSNMREYEICDVLRDDVVKTPFDRKAVLSNAPDTDGEMFIVPRVVD